MIGANIGGIPELIRDGETGFVFPSADVDALSELLDKVSAFDDQTLVNMGLAGRRWMEAEFGRQTHLQLLKEVYRGVGVNV